MVCPNCGETLRENAKFCSWCGERLDEIPNKELDEIPDEKLNEIPDEKLNETPDERLDETPDEKLDEIPDERLDETPDEELDEKPADMSEDVPAAENIPEVDTESIIKATLRQPIPVEKSIRKAAGEPLPVVESLIEHMRETAGKAVPEEESIPQHLQETEEETVPAEESVPEHLQETEEEAVPEEESIPEHLQEAEEDPAELAVEFDRSDDLFVVSRQPEPAAEEASETQSEPYRSISFSSRHGAIIFSAAVIAAACLSAIFFIPNRLMPYIKYKNAEELFQSGNYSAALAEFSGLGDYNDSGEYILKCRYGSAEALMEEGLFAEAAKEFSALEGYADSDSLASDCLVHSAEQYIAEGNYNAAVSAFYAAGKPELAENISRERAETLAKAGDYFAAADVAEKYSTEEAVEYIYLGSAKAMKEGDLKTASDGFAAITEYKDSGVLLKECLYGFYYTEYANNGASGEIVRGFRMLGDYKDSKEMFVQSAYEYGNLLLDKESFYEAAAMFRNAGAYKDSMALLHRSRYELGKSLEESDPASAHSIFALLGNYSDSAAKKRAAASNLGENGSDWYADGFTSVNGYCTSEFRKSDTLTVSCTAGTDAPSGPVTLVIIFMDGGDITVSADCENIRNSGSFSADIPLSSAAAGKAEVTVSVKESGKILRRFEINISE